MEVFLRHGYRKVTMEDIARGVGISRPALYLVFPGKEAVFRDLVQAGLDDVVDSIERGLPALTSLPAQLAHVFHLSTVASYERVARAPAAGELLNASFDFAKDLFERHEQRMVEVIARLISAAVARPDALRPSALDRARVIRAAAHGLKSVARDARDLRALVADLIDMTVAGLPLAARPDRRRARP